MQRLYHLCSIVLFISPYALGDLDVTGTPAVAACSTALDCSLNGDCVGGSCQCSAAWKGATCATLALQPASASKDLRHANISTWGMGTVHSNGQWHGYYSEMEEHCGLTSWETNSLIAHAVASSPGGPWRRVGQSSGVWSHNPATAVASDGTLLLFHIGSGAGGKPLNGSREYNAKCHNGYSPCGTHPWHHCNASSGPFADPVLRPSVTKAIDFFVAKDPNGPWSPFSAPLIGSTPLAGTNNPAPWVHPNGTVYIVFNSGNMTIVRADKWQGPYEVMTHGACGNGEDPFLYTDTNGHFHCLYHRSEQGFANLSVAGGHAFSEDGFKWTASEIPAYSATIEYDDGSVVPYGKRERPHLIFDPVSKEPTHLTTGVCLNSNWTLCNNNPWPGYYDYTFTSVQPVTTKKK